MATTTLTTSSGTRFVRRWLVRVLLAAGGALAATMVVWVVSAATASASTERPGDESGPSGGSGLLRGLGIHLGDTHDAGRFADPMQGEWRLGQGVVELLDRADAHLAELPDLPGGLAGLQYPDDNGAFTLPIHDADRSGPVTRWAGSGPVWRSGQSGTMDHADSSAHAAAELDGSGLGVPGSGGGTSNWKAGGHRVPAGPVLPSIPSMLSSPPSVPSGVAGSSHLDGSSPMVSANDAADADIVLMGVAFADSPRLPAQPGAQPGVTPD